MNLGELIEHLERLRQEHGDLPVCLEDAEDGYRYLLEEPPTIEVARYWLTDNERAHGAHILL